MRVRRRSSRDPKAGRHPGEQLFDVWSISTEVDYAIYTPFRARRLPWSDPISPPPGGDIDLVLQAVGGLRVINLDQRYDFEEYDVVASNALVLSYLGIGCEVDWSTRRRSSS